MLFYIIYKILGIYGHDIGHGPAGGHRRIGTLPEYSLRRNPSATYVFIMLLDMF